MFRKKLEDVLHDPAPHILIDLRKKEDYQKGTMPGAVNVYHGDFERYVTRLPKNKRIYLFCYTGETSDGLAEELSGRGYDIYSMEEGYHAYLRYKLKNMIP